MPLLKVSCLTAALIASQIYLIGFDRNLPVGQDTVVVIEYTITIPESQLIFPHNVSRFTPGQQQMLPNVEKALTGMKQGDEKHIDLSSDEAFGPYDESKRATVRKDMLPAGTEPGSVLITEEGVPFIVISLDGPMASIDFNHPLAGMHLVIDVTILEVEEALDDRAVQFGDQGDGRKFSI